MVAKKVKAHRRGSSAVRAHVRKGQPGGTAKYWSLKDARDKKDTRDVWEESEIHHGLDELFGIPLETTSSQRKEGRDAIKKIDYLDNQAPARAKKKKLSLSAYRKQEQAEERKAR